MKYINNQKVRIQYYKYFLLLFILCYSTSNLLSDDNSAKPTFIKSTDYTSNAIQNIDNRIANKYDPALNKTVFTTMYRNNFTRNPNCWASDLDLTCISPWNNRASFNRAGTLITPRHAILAAHYNLQVGDTIGFVTMDNLIIRKRIIGTAINTQSTNKPDFAIVTLESDLPSTIKPSKVIPSDFADYMEISTTTRVPALLLDQKENAIVADFEYIKNQYSLIVPINQKRLALNELGVSGDSGNPIFMILDDTLVLVGIFTFISDGPTYVCSGTSIARFATYPTGGVQPNQNLNDLIKASDTNAGINSGYKISFFDFSGATSTSQIGSTNSQLVGVNGRTLNFKFENKNKSIIRVFDLFGKLIVNVTPNNQLYTTELPNSGVYIISIIENLNYYSYKILIK